MKERDIHGESNVQSTAQTQKCCMSEKHGARVIDGNVEKEREIHGESNV